MRFAARTLDIRIRLALWCVALMAVAMVALSLLVYQLTRDSLLREVQLDVRQRAALIAAAQPMGKVALLAPRTDVFSAPDTFVQVLDPSGNVLGSSSNLGGRVLPFQPDAIRRDRVTDVRLAGEPLVLYGRSVSAGGQLQGYVLVARSPETIYMALARLQSILYPSAALALILGGLAGWFLVRHALGPLGRVSTAAARIAASRDHRQRIRYAGRLDEIGRLAQTIDGMLQSLEQAHQSLERAHAEVKAAHDTQKRFLADISHELRTPLTIMLSSLDLLVRAGGTDPEFDSRAVSDIRVETERMARMVTQVLIMAQSDADASIACQPTLVVDSLTDACHQLRPRWKNVALELHGMEALDDAVVLGNPDYLKQLFMILLDNAFRYTPAGGHVSVSGGCSNGEVAVTVADDGLGIPAADLPHIFDRFYRGANVRFREGLGLGLSIARHVAVQHAGRIEVESKPGCGTCFTVTLPLAVPAEPGGDAEDEVATVGARQLQT